MKSIKLVNFNVSSILDYGYSSHLYTFYNLINSTESNIFLKDNSYKYTPKFIKFDNKIKFDITDNKIKFINKHLYYNKDLSSAIYTYQNYKKLYINDFKNFINIVHNFKKIYRYLINKNYLVSFNFYDNDLFYEPEIFNYCSDFLIDNNLMPHIYHKSYNLDESIKYYMDVLKINDSEIINVDNNFFNLINSNYNIKNVAIINNSSYIGMPWIYYKLMEINNVSEFFNIFDFSKNILKNSKCDYLINEFNNLSDII